MCKRFPINDLFETEISKGKPPLIKRRFCITDTSLLTQLDRILVNGNPVPDSLKNQLQDPLQFYF
uniref:Uncharacterized protein n=1 Tax=uncultured marine thaumarchaeote AD1000_40_H03 TaxID=1455914 RepID=A0A075FQ78_9ARCH|nr:hypothetical protein [uncultured marine thaumarchaeote AD1000_40_H03]